MGFENGLKTIVVATDLGGQAEAALEYARKLATHYGARIVLAHGLDPMEYAAVDAVPGNVLSHMTEAARKVLDNWRATCCARGFTAIPRCGRAPWRRCWWMWRGSTRPG